MKPAKVWRSSRKAGSGLRRLELCGTNGHGRLTLPGRLQDVDVLDLGGNSLQDLPRDMSATLGGLQALLLRRNGLQEVPSSVLSLSALRELDVSHNHLMSLPDALSGLKSLQKLSVSHNRLQSLPAELGLLLDLEELDVSFNELRRLPLETSRLQKLRTLDVDHNRLSSFPAELCESLRLEELDLSGNRIISLPETLDHARSLTVLWLSNAQLGVLPESFCHAANLENVMLDGNSLDALPDAFDRLRRLKILNLSSNSFSVFPAVLLDVVNLEELYLSRNVLVTVPEGIDSLQKLTILWLDNNHLRCLPDRLVQLATLEELILQGNRIAILPDEFGKLCNLRVLNFKGNPLIQPPYEVCVKGVPYIAAYQKELHNQRPKTRPRLKLVVLGAKGSGKTLLKNCLTGSCRDDCQVNDADVSVAYWNANSDKQTVFIVYDFSGSHRYELLQELFLSPGALYVLVVDLKVYAAERFERTVGRYLRSLGAKVPGGVVCLVGTHADVCTLGEVEEKCLDIYFQIVMQEKRDCEVLGSLMCQVDQAIANRCHGISDSDDEMATFQLVSDRNLHRKRAQLSYLLKHRLQVLSPVLPVGVRGTLPCGAARLRDLIVSVAEHPDIFPYLQRVLPLSWLRLEELLARNTCGSNRNRKSGGGGGNGGGSLQLSWCEVVQLALQAGLTEDRLQSALSYMHDSGKLLHFEESEALRNAIFHDLPHLLRALGALLLDSEAQLARLEQAATSRDFVPGQLHHCLKGFHLHGLLPLPILRLLLQSVVPSVHDQDLLLQLLEWLGLCYRLKAGRLCPPCAGAGGGVFCGAPEASSASFSSATSCVWYKFPWFVKSEMPPAEAWLNNGGLLEHSFVVEQLEIQFRFPTFCPLAVFARYSARVNSHVVDRSDGRHCVCAHRGKVPVTLSMRHDGLTDLISISSHATLPNMWAAWQAVLPLVEELGRLLLEWPGLHYTLHVVCARCLRRGSTHLHTFPGELLTQPRPDGVSEVSCPLHPTEGVNIALIFPPTPVSLSPTAAKSALDLLTPNTNPRPSTPPVTTCSLPSSPGFFSLSTPSRSMSSFPPKRPASAPPASPSTNSDPPIPASTLTDFHLSRSLVQGVAAALNTTPTSSEFGKQRGHRSFQSLGPSCCPCSPGSPGSRCPSCCPLSSPTPRRLSLPSSCESLASCEILVPAISYSVQTAKPRTPPHGRPPPPPAPPPPLVPTTLGRIKSNTVPLIARPFRPCYTPCSTNNSSPLSNSHRPKAQRHSTQCVASEQPIDQPPLPVKSAAGCPGRQPPPSTQ
uniref:Multifunctional ROCO family signaling regulator 1 n=1 Tax=Eptatretus burgeri TaxID=7764 RepID=A0A8C4WWK7_EPTBU